MGVATLLPCQMPNLKKFKLACICIIYYILQISYIDRYNTTVNSKVSSLKPHFCRVYVEASASGLLKPKEEPAEEDTQKMMDGVWGADTVPAEPYQTII